ncbi:hypothetical protein AB0L40_05855 [Patulibacter sp. NPDC049589]|uniref:hypothetical protein n=1 Tax=Patulibacter sp. NPDC049589 TaxID=3154731 RepID=UPI00342DF16F
MGPLDLIRPAGDRLRRAAIALLLVAATLVAELLDGVAAGVVDGAATGPGLAGGEAVAGLGGLALAAFMGLRIARGQDVPSRGGIRLAAVLTAGLVVALVAHETLALGLHVEHGACVADLGGHVLCVVLPAALVLGAGMALVVGTRVVRAAVTARRRLPVAPRGPRVLERFVVAWTGDVVPARLLPALRLAGRAPPALAG